MITVGTETLHIPVEEELQPYLDQFDKATFRDNKLQSCSPFREDNSPSFAVHLENGSWIDSGATDYHRKGHFIQLLAFLRREASEDTVDYLLQKYSVSRLDISSLTVDMSWLHPKPKPKIFFTEELVEYAFRSPYLATRGISEEVQRAFRIGYDNQKQAVMMPWCNAEGQVVNLKFRSVNSKRFWYHAEGQRTSHYIYGLDKIVKTGIEKVWLVESEIDCLRLWTLGIPAIAFGTANMSKSQEQLLRNSPIRHMVIAVDNDAVGREFKQKLTDKFAGQFQLSEVSFPSEDIKDIGDMSDDQILDCQDKLKGAGINLKLCLK